MNIYQDKKLNKLGKTHQWKNYFKNQAYLNYILNFGSTGVRNASGINLSLQCPGIHRVYLVLVS